MQSFISLFSTICLLIFLSGQNSYATPEKDTGNIGEIRYSILSVANFQSIYGDEWVLMDGRNVVTSELYTSGLWTNENIPDARGIFFRCSNEGRNSATGNPDGDLEVGTYQKDEFKRHDHGGGDHDHGPRAGSEGFLSTSQKGRELRDGGNLHARLEMFGGVGKSGKIIHKEGGSETRPRCLIVNAFIKIRRTTEDAQTNEIRKAITESPNVRDMFRGLVQEEIRRVIAEQRVRSSGAK